MYRPTEVTFPEAGLLEQVTNTEIPTQIQVIQQVRTGAVLRLDILTFHDGDTFSVGDTLRYSHPGFDPVRSGEV